MGAAPAWTTRTTIYSEEKSRSPLPRYARYGPQQGHIQHRAQPRPHVIQLLQQFCIYDNMQEFNAIETFALSETDPCTQQTSKCCHRFFMNSTCWSSKYGYKQRFYRPTLGRHSNLIKPANHWLMSRFHKSLVQYWLTLAWSKEIRPLQRCARNCWRQLTRTYMLWITNLKSTGTATTINSNAVSTSIHTKNKYYILAFLIQKSSYKEERFEPRGFYHSILEHHVEVFFIPYKQWDCSWILHNIWIQHIKCLQVFAPMHDIQLSKTGFDDLQMWLRPLHKALQNPMQYYNEIQQLMTESKAWVDEFDVGEKFFKGLDPNT